MNVLIVSQCDKRALSETRRIVDQFAERRGDRTWQTPITQDGLDALRALLRQTARKNTAVACHWIRGLDHSELLWVVGDRRRFNDQGAVPTTTTQRDVLRLRDENDWQSDAGQDLELVLLPDDGAECGYRLCQLVAEDARRHAPQRYADIDRQKHARIPDAQVQGAGVQCWGPSDHMLALNELAEALGMTPEDCAKRYGVMTVRRRDGGSGWRLHFHPASGFTVV